MSELLWQPSAERVAGANLTAFRERAAQRWDVALPDYPALYRWSVEHSDKFWRSVWEFCDVRHSAPPTEILRHGERMPGAEWFRGARLNFAENLLRHDDDRVAIVARTEQGRRQTLTYRELRRQTAAVAARLDAAGIVPGDRVAALLPNGAEAVVAMLAAASRGAVWSSCSPDFGNQGVIDRFGQIEPRVLFVADGYSYNGAALELGPRVEELRRALPSLEHLVWAPFLNASSSPPPGAERWTDWISGSAELRFVDLPFDHPLYILYSSGTTGLPKGIVHGAGGTLVQHLKELVLHTDLKPDDVIFYFTTCGWMMWNWLVSSLAVGATVVLYDGSPFQPTPSALWDLADAEGVTVFGTSARYLAGVEKVGVRPGLTHRLERLRCLLSTGSPLSPASFDYVYRDIKADVQLSSISGGTDIVSCFALGNPVGAVYRGELQTRGLGMGVEVWDEEGNALRGAKGELVCTTPFPSMPLGFVNDPDGRKYQAAYFDRFPGTWRHGDYAELTEHDGMVIYGRSDATLNPGGVRIGTAEIYRIVERQPEVLESVVVAQEWRNDQRLVLFVKLREGAAIDDNWIAQLKQEIRTGASPRHVPAKVLTVADIPRTLSGKTVELAVRELIHGRPVVQREALANPESLELFRDLPALRQ